MLEPEGVCIAETFNYRMVGNFAGTNFCEIGQNSISEIFAVLIFEIGESETRGDCFRSRPCAAVWIVRLCLHNISAIAVKGTFADTLLLAAI